ncbi:MAG TPA: hypothetical protein VID04_04070, partial [Methylomirabilota bacterium]
MAASCHSGRIVAPLAIAVESGLKGIADAVETRSVGGTRVSDARTGVGWKYAAAPAARERPSRHA